MRNYTFLLLLLVAMGTGLSAQTIQTLSPIDDTYADGGKSTEILGNTQPQQMWVKTGSTAAFTRTGFIKFDISGLSLADVGTAKLRLYCYDTQSTDMVISAFSIGCLCGMANYQIGARCHYIRKNQYFFRFV